MQKVKDYDGVIFKFLFMNFIVICLSKNMLLKLDIKISFDICSLGCKIFKSKGKYKSYFVLTFKTSGIISKL